MAKNKKRDVVGLACTECKSQNYVSEKNKLNTQEALELNKWCKICKKVTKHKEVKKLD